MQLSSVLIADIQEVTAFPFFASGTPEIAGATAPATVLVVFLKVDTSLDRAAPGSSFWATMTGATDLIGCALFVASSAVVGFSQEVITGATAAGGSGGAGVATLSTMGVIGLQKDTGTAAACLAG